MRARAAASIQQGRVHLAAIYYAQSGLSFDEVALSLLRCLPDAPNSAGTPVGAGVAAESSASANPLAPLVESNLSYFGDSSSGSNNRGSAAYTRVSYTSPSIVDAAVSQGCALTPLRVFLLQVLRSLPLGAKMQRTMLSTWLCDLYLHQISLARLLNKQAEISVANASAAASGVCWVKL